MLFFSSLFQKISRNKEKQQAPIPKRSIFEKNSANSPALIPGQAEAQKQMCLQRYFLTPD